MVMVINLSEVLSVSVVRHMLFGCVPPASPAWWPGACPLAVSLLLLLLLFGCVPPASPVWSMNTAATAVSLNTGAQF